MSKEKYEKVLEWCLSQGAKLHPDIERKQENGLWGMFATASIPKNTVIAKFPRDKVFQMGDAYTYPKDMAFNERYIHAVAKSICTEEKLWGGFYDFYSLEDLKENMPVFMGNLSWGCWKI
ncbi:hypothetical protein QQM79_18900 [Marinobacteraceae bacterium S3BR75-40.1]